MIEDITIRNLSPATLRSYVHAVAKFSHYFGRSWSGGRTTTPMVSTRPACEWGSGNYNAWRACDAKHHYFRIVALTARHQRVPPIAMSLRIWGSPPARAKDRRTGLAPVC